MLALSEHGSYVQLSVDIGEHKQEYGSGGRVADIGESLSPKVGRWLHEFLIRRVSTVFKILEPTSYEKKTYLMNNMQFFFKIKQ